MQSYGFLMKNFPQMDHEITTYGKGEEKEIQRQNAQNAQNNPGQGGASLCPRVGARRARHRGWRTGRWATGKEPFFGRGHRGVRRWVRGAPASARAFAGGHGHGFPGGPAPGPEAREQIKRVAGPFEPSAT